MPIRERLVNALASRSKWVSSGGPKVLGAAIALFAVGVALTVGDVPARSSLRMVWLVPAALLSLATLVINGYEFRIIAAFVGRKIGAWRSIRVSAMSSAANVLPIPGAAIVKIQALRGEDVRFRPAASATAAVGLIWIGTGFILTAVLALFDGRTTFGAGCLAGAVACMAAAVILIPDRDARIWRRVANVVVFEAAATGMTTVRLFTVAAVLGTGSGWTQAAALALIGILSTATGIFPGGLGIRELLSAAVAGFVGLDVSIAVLIAALDRIVSYATLGLVVAGIALADRSSRSEEPVS